ncbi:MAG: aspartate-semialdehyde dehydrogenase [Ekhidna sp.]|uniref:aspartate-semialdehyde dehydrogenase n=1 Tax=Ekhidna sp. TaxID=2608089 RepID=UPI0032ECC80A
MKVAVVGASGLVGQKMLQIMSERNFPVEELLPVASERSIGKTITYNGKDYAIISMEDAIAAKPDIALFSAGGSVSLEFAPKFAEVGTVVIDNSSAWRMDPTKKLVVPEVNGHVLRIDDRIIANPNCSTIQMVIALKPLHDEFKIQRIVVSTYQSVTGSGKGAVDQLEGERSGKDIQKVYPHKIDMNALPHIDVFLENGYTKEEMKMVNETKKIMGDDSIKVTSTCVRIPTMGGHSEAINVEFEKEYTLEQIYSILDKAHGVTVVDNPDNNEYPMPLIAHDKDDVFVGRIRRDETQPKTLNMWVVSDNLRKGAATNAIQIAEYMLQHSLVY